MFTQHNQGCTEDNFRDAGQNNDQISIQGHPIRHLSQKLGASPGEMSDPGEQQEHAKQDTQCDLNYTGLWGIGSIQLFTNLYTQKERTIRPLPLYFYDCI